MDSEILFPTLSSWSNPRVFFRSRQEHFHWLLPCPVPASLLLAAFSWPLHPCPSTPLRSISRLISGRIYAGFSLGPLLDGSLSPLLFWLVSPYWTCLSQLLWESLSLSLILLCEVLKDMWHFVCIELKTVTSCRLSIFPSKMQKSNCT